MWEGNNIKEQMETAHKDLRYTIAETLYRREIVESILSDWGFGAPDQLSLDIMVFLEITNRLTKVENKCVTQENATTNHIAEIV